MQCPMDIFKVKTIPYLDLNIVKYKNIIQYCKQIMNTMFEKYIFLEIIKMKDFFSTSLLSLTHFVGITVLCNGSKKKYIQ